MPMIGSARATRLPWKKPSGSIITLHFSNIAYDVEVKALSKFRPVTDYEAENVRGGARTKLDYLFIAYAKESVVEIMDMIECTTEANHFGRLTQTNGDQFAFRGPENAKGPLPVTKRDSLKANAALLVRNKRKQVIEDQQRVAEVIDACGGLSVPPVPNEADIEGRA